MNEIAEYRTDDVDQYRDEKPPTLRIFQGGNGDWYVAIAPEGDRLAPRSSVVRVTTSGVRVQGLAPAIADAYRALTVTAETLTLHRNQFDAFIETRMGRANFESEPDAVQRLVADAFAAGRRASPWP